MIIYPSTKGIFRALCALERPLQRRWGRCTEDVGQITAPGACRDSVLAVLDGSLTAKSSPGFADLAVSVSMLNGFWMNCALAVCTPWRSIASSE